MQGDGRDPRFRSQRPPSRPPSEESGDERRRHRRARDAAFRDDGEGGRSYDGDRGSGKLRRRDRYGESHGRRRRSRSRSPVEHRDASRERFRRSPSPQHLRVRDADRNSAEKSLRHPSRQQRDDEDRRMSRFGGGPEKQVARTNNDLRPFPAETSLTSKPTPEKEKPNFAPTGILAKASNTVSKADGTSIVLKYHEPPEARKPPPRDQWKLFVFKGADVLETIELSIRSCWLIGREVSVVELLAEHPSISKQHAVIQFRWIEKRNEFGDKTGKVKPYLIDLESANGTMLNKEPIPASRYLELRDKDMIQFGDSTREYVLMLPPKD